MEDFEETVGKIGEKFSFNYYRFTQKMNTLVFVNCGFPQCLNVRRDVSLLSQTRKYRKLY